jgi:hypothetical protein
MYRRIGSVGMVTAEGLLHEADGERARTFENVRPECAGKENGPAKEGGRFKHLIEIEHQQVESFRNVACRATPTLDPGGF